MSSRARLFEYGNHWLVRRKDTPQLHIYWCKPGSRRVRRKSTHTGDLEQAKAALIAFVHERQRPKDRSPESVPILEALNHYVEHTLDGRISQPKAVEALGQWSRFLEQEQAVWVNDLSVGVQERFIEWRMRDIRSKGYIGSNGTIIRELGVLRAALTDYWKRGFIQSVPHIRSLPEPPPRERFLTAEEFQRLLAECREPHLRLFVMMAVHTMQRPSALLQLRASQVCLVRSRIDFLPRGEVQSNKRRPVVPITATLRPHLEHAIAHSQSGHVIEFEGRPVKAVRTSFGKAAKRAGLQNVSPYVLRHTGATLAASAGVPLRQIAGMLGHTETRTSERYAKHHPDYLRDAAKALDHLFPEQRATLCAPTARQSRQRELLMTG